MRWGRHGLGERLGERLGQWREGRVRDYGILLAESSQRRLGLSHREIRFQETSDQETPRRASAGSKRERGVAEESHGDLTAGTAENTQRSACKSCSWRAPRFFKPAIRVSTGRRRLTTVGTHEQEMRTDTT